MPYTYRGGKRRGTKRYSSGPYRKSRYVYGSSGITARRVALRNRPIQVAQGPNMVEDPEGQANQNTICRVPGITVPDKTLVKLKYVQRVNMSITAAAQVQIQKFSGNSAFDPDYTGVGTQPNGYDQWAAFYSKYCVMASKFKVKLIPTGTTAPTSALEAVVVPVPSTSTPAGATIDAIKQQKYACWNVFGQGMDLPRCETYMETGKLYGKSKDAIKAEDNFSALVTADPATEWTWILATTAVDQSSSCPCYAYVEVVYYVMFSDRYPITD